MDIWTGEIQGAALLFGLFVEIIPQYKQIRVKLLSLIFS